MSRSKNVRSKYQVFPEYVRASVSVRDSGKNHRSRDERGSDLNIVRAVITSILEDTQSENKEV